MPDLNADRPGVRPRYLLVARLAQQVGSQPLEHGRRVLVVAMQGNLDLTAAQGDFEVGAADSNHLVKSALEGGDARAQLVGHLLQRASDAGE